MHYGRSTVTLRQSYFTSVVFNSILRIVQWHELMISITKITIATTARKCRWSEFVTAARIATTLTCAIIVLTSRFDSIMRQNQVMNSCRSRVVLSHYQHEPPSL